MSLDGLSSMIEQPEQLEGDGSPVAEVTPIKPLHTRTASMEHHHRLSQRGSYSGIPSTAPLPLTPTTSLKGHSRFSSGSSLASSPPVRASMDSYVSKRPLAQLAEHPEERESEMGGLTAQDSADQFDTFPSISFHSRHSSREEPSIDYDWAENLPFEPSEPTISVAKRRRADKSTPSMLSTKIASRFPSISRKFKSRSEKRSSSITDGLSLHDSFHSRSRASSMRSATTRESSLDVLDRRELVVLPTPRNSYIQEEPTQVSEEPVAEILEEESEEDQEPEEKIEHPGLSRTPLLPPVLAIRCDTEESIQSPLQSPRVAETPTTTPPSPYEQPSVHVGIPSPPLSARPSVASFHHRSIVPSSQIPPIALSGSDGPDDEWALALGHENFTIQPEPYLPPEPTFESCRQLKADWEQAEREFGRHLARIRAVYSATSKIAQLTEQKWAVINGLWMSYHGQALEAATRKAERTFHEGNSRSVVDQLALSRRTSLHEPVPMAQIPSHLVGGKFPNFGDAGIVGPMEVVKPLSSALKGPRSRKRGFWKFLQDLIPGGLVSGKA